MSDPQAADLNLGAITVLVGTENGRYPDGNSVLIAGAEESILIDPSLTVYARGGVPGGVDRILLSHPHEDHVPALGLFPDTPVLVHEDDLVGVRSLDGLLEVYGFEGELARAWSQTLIDDFHIEGRPDAEGFVDGARFDLGGGRNVTVIHLPGHTRGHSGFLVEPDGFFFVGDVDLTSFGPYYGDAWSDLDSFERSIARCRDIEARWYATFHHKGLVEGRDRFVAHLDAFGEVISRREARLLSYLAEPRTLEEIARYRIVYRPSVTEPWIDMAERRTARLHLDRLLPLGKVTEVEPGRYRAA